MEFSHLEFSHLKDDDIRMVDVSEKSETLRTATAQAVVTMKSDVMEMIISNRIKKGNVLLTAKTAGIMAAKKTSDMIPLCHNIFITSADISYELSADKIRVLSTVSAKSSTGVEMEALTAVSIAALTIYDMCKSADKAIEISGICLLTKTGGRSGSYIRVI